MKSQILSKINKLDIAILKTTILIVSTSIFFFTGIFSLHAQQNYRGQGSSVLNEYLSRDLPYNSRTIKSGNGMEGDQEFIEARTFYFIQFGVYSMKVNAFDIPAPNIGENVWLIHHAGTRIVGQRLVGAYYIVKAFASRNDAEQYVSLYRSQGVDCWINNKLSEVPFTLLAIKN